MLEETCQKDDNNLLWLWLPCQLLSCSMRDGSIANTTFILCLLLVVLAVVSRSMIDLSNAHYIAYPPPPPPPPPHTHTHTHTHTHSTGEFILGRVIRAMSQCWHPRCFKCVSCHTELADVGFVKNQGRYVTTSKQSYPNSDFSTCSQATVKKAFNQQE